MADRRGGLRDAVVLGGRRRWLQWGAAALTLAIGLVITSVLATANAEQQAEQARLAAAAHAGQHAERIAAELDPMDAFAESLRAFISTDPDGTEPVELKSFMSGLYAEWGELRAVAVAPDNRVSAVVPLEGNEAAIGLYYPENLEQWPSVQQAMASGEPVLVGPVNLVQGGQGFIYRMPVFLPDGSYWGIVSAVASVESLFGDGEDGAGFAVRQSGDPTTTVLGEEAAFAGDPAVATISALGTQWDIAVPIPAPDISTANDIRIAGTVASVVLAIAVFLLMGALRREHALARLMTDLSARAPGVLFQLRQRRDGTRVMSYASSGAEALLAQADPSSTDDLAVFAELVHPDDFEAVIRAVDESAATLRPWHQRFRVALPETSVTWLLADARPVREGSEVVWHGWVSDITEDLKDEDALRVSASLFEVTRDGVTILDADGVITEVNAGMEAISGFGRDELVGTRFVDHCRGLTPAEVFEDMWRQLARHGYWRGEITGQRKDGAARTDSAVASAVRDAAGDLSHYIVVLDNRNLARDDSVTGLPHARLLDERARQAQVDARATGTLAVLIVMGLDQFHRVNDTYGHRVGDQLLGAVAARLEQALPTGGTLVRLRGDEFAMVLADVSDLAEVDEITRSALASLAAPFDVAGRSLRTTAAAGISVYPADASDVTELHVHANQAMRAAKALGPGEYRFFNADMQSAVNEQAQLAEDLQVAISTDQITMAFQPIVDLRTGEVHRAEALMRWDHPELGAIPPDRFIPLAERSGVIGKLGDIAFASSVRALTELHAVDPDFAISVNLSPVELRGLAARHARRIHNLVASGNPSSALIVEITEGVLLSDDPGVHANLRAYRDGGARIAIDDFGTGYSSLAYLQRLDVDLLKIDRAFVDGLAPGSDSLSLCEAIIEMAHKMGIEVVAEGVETSLQNDLLAAAGCDAVQGFFHSRPLPLPTLLSLISSGHDD